MPHDYDIVIVGAGMVGASLAIALAPTGLNIGMIEPVELGDNEQPSYDDRGLALSHSSKRILDALGVWDPVVACSMPIKKIHVSEQGRFGCVHLAAADTDYKELGYVVTARLLGQALYKRFADFDNINLICPAQLSNFQDNKTGLLLDITVGDELKTISTKLLVGADGHRSLTRRLAGLAVKEHDFQQTAIVASVTTQKANDGTAYERFTSHGPIALLPVNQEKSVLVFTVNRDSAEHYLSMSEREYLDNVESEFGRRLGRFIRLGHRRAYPVVFIEVTEQFRRGLVLLGNAAHTIHPNGAQGFNLGLRDVAGLAECVFAGLDKGLDVDDAGILQDYMALRRDDQRHVIRFTNGLAKGFYNRYPLIGSVRSLFLLVFDLASPCKQAFIESAMGISGLQPKWVREYAA